jgi:hypothetical protein
MVPWCLYGILRENADYSLLGVLNYHSITILQDMNQFEGLIAFRRSKKNTTSLQS